MSSEHVIIKKHLAHGVELYQTSHHERIAEFRCEACNQHLCWASMADLQTWLRFGAELKPKVSTKDNLLLIMNERGRQ